MLKIYLIAGEASGDNIASKLMNAIKNQNKNVEFYGIGGEKMQESGMNLLFPSQELSVMGFLEILPHIPKFIKRIKQTVKDIIKLQPDVVITIDSPGFSFRVAKKVKNHIKGKLIHYVAPTVWAYKPDRAKKIAKIYDHLLVILPFEPKYFIKEGLDTSFVGHPAIENLKHTGRELFRKNHQISDNNLLVCLAPGSRPQEIKNLLPIFLKAVDYLQEKIDKKITVAIPTKPYLKSIIQTYTQNSPNILLISEKDKESLFSSSDLALTKSGTITTELAFYQMPMVIAHKVNSLSYWLLKRMIKIKYATIINLLADKELIPELLQEKCNSISIGEALYHTTQPTNTNLWKQKIKEQLAKLQVNNKTPSELAAKKILELLLS